ncbi:DnaJ subfamily C member 21 [Chionoecetes opilio]|uniref:DnaJ subfamily C member 21 n=1 Tax=Chionoecetes opilio TaxID=41210 RepID=A0A8J4YXL7_CHIOP|nr:DnaJ subfamily C member 21 [Chionoecetes opilio]
MMKPFIDYYEVLNVSRHVTPDEVKRAYRRLARIHHPDKNLDNVLEAAENFKVIKAAADTLSDPRQKALYDREYRQYLHKRKREERCWEREHKRRRQERDGERPDKRKRHEDEDEDEGSSEDEFWQRVKKVRRDCEKA